MNTTAGCPHPNWVLCVNTFRLVILAWNRPHSLARLLDSVTATHWDWPASPAWDVVIDIQVRFSIYTTQSVGRRNTLFHFNMLLLVRQSRCFF